MYMLSEMMNIGLGDRTWPTETYQKIAEKIIICNPNVRTAETMKEVISAILSVPKNKIGFVTYNQLVKKHKMPDVGIPE